MKQTELIKLLKSLQALPKECEWAEFKVHNWNPQAIGEYLSALSNSARYLSKPYGYLVFGIENETHRLVGTTFYPLTVKKGSHELENWLVTQLNPRIDLNIFEFDYEDKHFALFRIDATRDRPVSFRGETFIRIGSYKKSLDDHPERERKIWHRTNHVVFEKGIAFEKASSDEVLSMIDYPKYFEMSNLPLPDNRKGILERFTQDRIIEACGDKYNITNPGGIMFAKDLEQFDSLARKAIRVIVYQGNSRVKTKKEQLDRKGYVAGFEGLIKYILDQLPTNEVIEQGLRKEVTIYIRKSMVFMCNAYDKKPLIVYNLLKIQ
jgi:ATP-dependent DNA helicase RecG